MHFWLACYFVLACVIAAGVLLPDWRASIAQQLRGGVSRAAVWLRRASARQQSRGSGAARSVLQLLQGGLRWLSRRGHLMLAALAVVALPVLIALALQRWNRIEGFDERASMAVADSKVAQLLAGEQLVPPPPLPPEVFATIDVQRERPMLDTADRRWNLLEDDFRQRLLLAFKIMREQHGYDLALLEGYRSPERQTALQALGPNVTRAGAYQSFHQYGLAADVAFMRAGRLVISEKDPWAMRGYELYGEVAESLGLTWGGRWQLMDFGHAEYRRPGFQRAAGE